MNSHFEHYDNESLLAAASAGAVDTLTLLLDERGANINTVDRFRQTALSHAILARCQECALFLLDRGIDWRIHNKRGLRALHLAASMGLVIVIDRLLDAGDEVNTSRTNTDTPLIIAARNGKTDAVRCLLNAGGDPHGRGAKRMTALHVAANAEITEMLLKAGAAPDARNKDGETPLFDAARTGRLDQIQLLVGANVDVHVVNDKNETALLQAAQRGAVEAVDYLLDIGAKAILPGQQGRSFANVARRNASLHTYMTARAARGCIDAALAEIARSV